VVLPCAVQNTFDKFYCALSQLPSRYPKKVVFIGGAYQVYIPNLRRGSMTQIGAPTPINRRDEPPG
jgi:hypothetical protein